MSTPRSAVIRSTDLDLTPEDILSAIGRTRQGGAYEALLRPPKQGFGLSIDDAVFIIAPESDDLMLVGHGLVIDSLVEPSRIGLHIRAIVDRAEGYQVPPSGYTRALKDAAPVFPRQISDTVADRWLVGWHAHLKALGWWGDLTQVEDLIEKYAQQIHSPTGPIKVPPGTLTTSELSFELLTKAHQAPLVLALARTYLNHVGLHPSEYSISALPSTRAGGRFSPDPPALISAR